MEHRLTAERSSLNSMYYLIRLNGRLWRVCHQSQLKERYPNIEIKET